MPLSDNVKKKIESTLVSYLELKINLYDRDIPELIALLKNKQYITSLEIAGGNIGEEGAIKLAELNHLTHLNLSANYNITNKAIYELLKNKNLVFLNVSGNLSIKDDLARRILAGDFNPTRLDITQTSISYDLIEKVDDYYYHNLHKELKKSNSTDDLEQKEAFQSHPIQQPTMTVKQNISLHNSFSDVVKEEKSCLSLGLFCFWHRSKNTKLENQARRSEQQSNISSQTQSHAAIESHRY